MIHQGSAIAVGPVVPSAGTTFPSAREAEVLLSATLNLVLGNTGPSDDGRSGGSSSGRESTPAASGCVESIDVHSIGIVMGRLVGRTRNGVSPVMEFVREGLRRVVTALCASLCGALCHSLVDLDQCVEVRGDRAGSFGCGVRTQDDVVLVDDMGLNHLVDLVEAPLFIVLGGLKHHLECVAPMRERCTLVVGEGLDLVSRDIHLHLDAEIENEIIAELLPSAIALGRTRGWVDNMRVILSLVSPAAKLGNIDVDPSVRCEDFPDVVGEERGVELEIELAVAKERVT